MDSGLSSDDWANIPAEILANIIYGDVKNSPAEIVRLRSVCRWWRLSIPRPLNKVSALFPLRPSVLGKSRSRYDFVIDASAVYLVRSRSDPSKACLVSVQEASAGNLVLRDPLENKQIFNSPVDADWIIDTQTLLARSYAYNETCFNCHQIAGTKKVDFVADSGSGCRELVGVCEYFRGKMFAFRTDLIGRAAATTSSLSLASHQLHGEIFYGDVVAFNGRIIAVDNQGRIYTLDHTSLNLIQLNSITIPSNIPKASISQHLVVSDGDLYLVSISYVGDIDPSECQTYRLVISTAADDDPTQIPSLVVEKVEDLGGDDDRVFFITMTCSFSVSARHLPPPWKGNCIVYRHMASTMCECNTACPSVYPDYKPNPEIFFLGGGGGQNPRYASISSLQGYSDLISPGALLLQIKDLDHKAGLME